MDETLAGGHAALAFVLHMDERDWVGAEREYRRALELAPNDNYYRWGWALFELSAARYSEAAADLRWALEQAPLSPALHGVLTRALACAGRYEEAEAVADPFGEGDPGVVVFMGRIRLRQGAQERALGYFERAVEMTDGGTVELASLAHALAAVGRTREALALIPELEARGAWIPGVYAELGDGRRAVEELELGYDQRRPEVLSLRCFSAAAYSDLTTMEALAREPRMQDLLRRIDFPR